MNYVFCFFFFFLYDSLSLPSCLPQTLQCSSLPRCAEDFNLATTLWIPHINQPIREQLNKELAGTRAVDTHSSCSHPKVRGHDMRLILYDESAPNHPTCRISLSNSCSIFHFLLVSVVQLQLNQNNNNKKNIYR